MEEEGHEVAETGREGHSGPVLCPPPNSLTQARSLPSSHFLHPWVSFSCKSHQRAPISSCPSALRHSVSYFSSAPLCVLFIYLFILLCNFIINFLSELFCHSSVPGEISHQPGGGGGAFWVIRNSAWGQKSQVGKDTFRGTSPHRCSVSGSHQDQT